MRTALFISPHLDDVAFSCGGLAARMASAGWNTVLATVFTATVMPVVGFALECQLDKGLSAHVDYMALRRAEDRQAATILEFSDVRWMDLPEAPHRGYHSAAALFGPIQEQDSIVPRLRKALSEIFRQVGPDLTLIPQVLGNHVDHQVVSACVRDLITNENSACYRDTPYAIRDPDASPAPHLRHMPVVKVPIDETALLRKIAAAQAYTTQVNFQFKDANTLDRTLREFALREGDGSPGERFLSSSPHMKGFAE